MGKSRRKCSGNLAAITWVISALAISWPHSLYAHAGLVRARPASNATVSPPAQLELWFNELLEDGFNFVEVLPAKQLASDASEPWNLARGKPTIDSHDGTHLTVTLKPLPPGTYVVRWRVLSRDGHSSPGKFSFKVTE